MDTLIAFDLVTLAAALGCGLIGGVFFAFSTFIMRGLGNLPPSQGIAAMQSINITVINPWFMTAFLGTAVLCIYIAIAALLRWQTAPVAFLLAGSVLYLLGTILVTFVFNVPRNDALARLSPSNPDAATFWASYLSSWTAWNHVRTAASLAAAVSLILALRARA